VFFFPNVSLYDEIEIKEKVKKQTKNKNKAEKNRLQLHNLQ
jgi:hypothetical protein